MSVRPCPLIFWPSSLHVDRCLAVIVLNRCNKYEVCIWWRPWWKTCVNLPIESSTDIFANFTHRRLKWHNLYPKKIHFYNGAFIFVKIMTISWSLTIGVVLIENVRLIQCPGMYRQSCLCLVMTAISGPLWAARNHSSSEDGPTSVWQLL